MIPTLRFHQLFPVCRPYTYCEHNLWQHNLGIPPIRSKPSSQFEMASFEPVSEGDWERHKDVIKEMYCKDKRPLLNRKKDGNEPGVVELMRQRHGFSASPSQYELQFKKWGFTKNLKSSEWVALIAQYDRLRQTKSDVRITISGSVLNKNKIDRARRRYRSDRIGIQGAGCKGGSLPASRQAHVEFLDDSGEWTKSTESEVETSSSTSVILRKNSHIAVDASLDVRTRPKTPPLGTDPSLSHYEQPVDLALSCPDAFSGYEPFSPIINLDEILTLPIFDVDDCPFTNLASSSSNLHGQSRLSAICPGPTANSISASHSESSDQQIVLGRDETITTSRLDGARTLITSLVQHSRSTSSYTTGAPTEAEIPGVEETIESLESLVPEDVTPSSVNSDSTLSTKGSFQSSDLFRTLLYSFKNNFAGLRDIPRASIMQLIRDHHDIRIQLFDIIKGGEPCVAKPLADSFFRAAVEGSDANAVTTIIHHTKYNPRIAINPDDVVCRYEEDDYTPIELASKFRNTELVRTLLAAGADPNKTHASNHDGALGLALGRWDNGSQYPFQPSPPGEPEPVNPCLLKLLLDSGAEVHIDLLEDAMRPGPGHTAIAEELLSRLSASRHQMCFQSQWLLVSAVHYLENSNVNGMVRALFAHCSMSQGCGKCVSENPILIEKLLCHAARRANVDLVMFLVQHTSQLQSGLAAAIRASSDELVEFLLNQGARVGDPVTSWQDCNSECCPDLYDECGYDRQILPGIQHHSHDYVITPIRTPLAEGIRSRNDHLIRTVERLGAHTRLSDKHHFHAAVVAAAEVGNISYLRMVLDHACNDNEGSRLALALAVAIRNEETDAALMLLDAGADMDASKLSRMHGDPFILALERFNQRVVDSMLECDITLMSISHPNNKSALEAAAAWCDIGLIKDLLQLGADLNLGIKATPLGAAVKTRNKNFVSQILDLGAKPEAEPRDPTGITPLRAAIEIGDYEIARLLISKGAPSADNCAFLYVMSHDPVGYEYLLSEFKTQYPHGLPGFGYQLLARAIELDSRPLMESLLEAGVDVNSWGPMFARSFQSKVSGVISFGHRSRVLGVAIQHRKAQNYDLIRELLRRGANANLIVYEYKHATVSGLIWFRKTPLHLAIESKNLQVARVLIEHGAEINRPARRGIKQTPLQAACEIGSYSMVEFLLKEGARVNDAAAERHGGTALQLAAKSGSLKIVRLLLDNGADLFMPKSKVGGRTAFEAAAESGCIDVLCQLWNAVLPLGFSAKECQSAKELARQKGHRGCVDFIDFLGGGSSQPYLQG
ncbi:hypothetical protein KVR01_012163 [Diaporthe batatas]|uniref:uncharacterized protein n=1 Tax=Diaporthe batatas TaxID=748121 RepID=UPI001D03B235|nr:uncharacterized protein KVR01_012163 [Diaporthe batatas]KAG8157891.1 hypothetical protein KVR01_012163 [Diaporthe batatas]